MTKTEEFVRSVLGRGGKGYMPFVLAIDLTAQLLFEEGIAMKDILVIAQGTVLCVGESSPVLFFSS